LARPSRYQIMELFKPDIIAVLKQMNKSLFTNVDMNSTFFLHKEEWRLPQKTSVHDFLQFLLKKKIVKELVMKSPKGSVTRYIFGENTDPYTFDANLVALSLYPNSYLSHFSAVHYHGLTDEIIKTIYVNKEQSQKQHLMSEGDKPLLQEKIDSAFSKPMRKTNNFYEYGGQRIYILNGKYTNKLGILEETGYSITNLERTLIDIAVRPEYSGGVFEVLQIYEKAKGLVSVNKMKAYLSTLDYKYPYHQVIGFYLERAGYRESAVGLMESLPIEFNFYLTYEMKNPDYSDRWKLYFPKNL